MSHIQDNMPRLDDMRLFAKLAELGSFTATAKALDLPKQTLSRRIAALEQDLGVDLVQRTTHKVRLTELGVAYAERCRELARVAREANELVQGSGEQPRGLLRITADPTFGEAHLPALVREYIERYAETEVEVVLTSRVVDLLEEGFDLGFRVGRPNDPSLVATRVRGAKLVYCAAPSYVAKHGRPTHPDQLGEHAILEHTPRAGPSRWPFVGPDGQLFAVQVRGRVRLNSLPMIRSLALAGLGIANLPDFACAEDVKRKRLVELLGDWVGDVGGIWLVRPQHKLLAARMRCFVDLALERLRSR